MKRTLTAFICFLLIFVIGMSQAAAAAPRGETAVGMQEEKATRTILLYICGSNLEADFANATYNLEQIMDAKFSAGGDVKCIAMTGGSESWYVDSEYLRDPYEIGLSVSEETGEYTVSAEYNQLWEVKGADAPEDPGTMTLLDADGVTGAPGEAVLSEDELMTDPESLKAFINYGVTNYPAEKYDLILWDHGGGPSVGFGYDDHDYYGESMSFPDIIDAVSHNLLVDADSDSKPDGKFDFIDFDACLMGSVELCFALADYADYYIASPETEPGYGQYYTGWLDQLGREPDCDTFELGKRIVDDFMEFYTTGEGAGDYGTLSVYDLNKLTAPETGFVSAMSDLQSVMKAQTNTKSDGEYLFYDELASVRDSLHYNEDEFIDLGNLASLLSIAVLEPSDAPDWSNAYTEIACRIMTILSQSEENDVIYARGSECIQTDFLIYREANGDLQLGSMPTSGIYIFFPCKDSDSGDISRYCDAMNGVLQKMPESDRKDFLSAYMDTVVDYALIKCTGKTVSELINRYDVDKSEIDFDLLYEHWHDVPSYYPDDSYSEWNRAIKYLFDLRPDGLSDATKTWIGEIVRQQADEAITSANVSVDKIRYDYGDEYILHLKGVNERVVQGAEREIYAELPALEAYIQEYQEKNRLFLEYAGMLSVGKVYGAIDDSSQFSPDEENTDEISSDWRLSSFEQKWLAVKDADGNNHVAAIHKSDENGIQIPAFYGTPEEPHPVFLGFKYDEENEDELVLDTIWYRGAYGSVRGTKAKELTGELTVCTMILATAYIFDYCIPISGTTFTITKDNYTSVKLAYTDIADIPDIADVDEDGSAFYGFVSVTDIYGDLIDVSDQVDQPDREYLDISLGDVQPATVTGGALSPVVKYEDQILEEGVDYTWSKINFESEIDSPGEYYIALYGMGRFSGKAYKEFVVTALPGDADLDGEVTITDATVIQRVLAGMRVERFGEIAADVDGDGEVTIFDASAIQRFLAELPSPLDRED